MVVLAGTVVVVVDDGVAVPGTVVDVVDVEGSVVVVDPGVSESLSDPPQADNANVTDPTMRYKRALRTIGGKVLAPRC